MLLSLHIKDFAIIDDLEVEFGPGLNVMTGETGAGKTIIVEALKLVLGARAQSDAVRAGKEKAFVTAVFDAKEISAVLKNFIENAGVECGEDLVISRVVGAQGKGRIAVGGVPVTGAILKELGEHLVDVSSQHEHQLLLEPREHGNIVDVHGGLAASAARYGNAHITWVCLDRELRELKENEKAAREKLDYLKFQFDELAAADLKPGELGDIEAERSRLKYAGALEERSRAAWGLLYGDAGSTAESIDRALQLILQCAEHDRSAEKWHEALLKMRGEVEDVSREISRYADGLESNPARLGELDERMHMIRGLMKKHGDSIEACIAKKEKLAAEMDDIARYDEMIEEKEGLLAAASKERREAALKWSGGRKKAAERFSKAVAAELANLGMGKAKFEARVQPRPEPEWDELGPDTAEFLISPNIGEPLKPLVRIASGGELSRVMLAIKSVLADKGGFVPTSIFDEVDSGIGGAVAEVVGKKLKNVARARQVICITHLPQVAVQGARHLKISKDVKDGRTFVRIDSLPDGERANEIARMLGGEKITNATMIHAREMLENAVNREP